MKFPEEEVLNSSPTASEMLFNRPLVSKKALAGHTNITDTLSSLQLLPPVVLLLLLLLFLTRICAALIAWSIILHNSGFIPRNNIPYFWLYAKYPSSHFRLYTRLPHLTLPATGYHISHFRLQVTTSHTSCFTPGAQSSHFWVYSRYPQPRRS